MTAAKAALRRKKQHEHTLEQTTAQVATLEQQIYSIEAANINRETLAAMERAGEAMQQIHGKLNIDKVDETMYVHLLGSCEGYGWRLTMYAGRSFENNMLWARKLLRLLPVHLLANLSIKQSWMMSWRSSSKSNWTIRC